MIFMINAVNVARLVVGVCLAASLSACAISRPLGGDPALKIIESELPKPERVDLTAVTAEYYVGPFDRLSIDVFGIPVLSQREVQVDSGGRISFPLIGVLDINGLTLAQVEAAIMRGLGESHVRNPQVTVNLKETISRVITVEGQVRKPGLYPAIGRMTLMSAIAKAEGTDEFSKLDDVVIFRTVAGQRYAALYDLDAIRHGAYADPQVFASDVVMVGDSRARRLFKDLLAITPALVTPLVISIDRLTRP
ncbi:polysaccharide biosynthesis/export family protein [Novosphingobium sp. AAP83]|uniref:polysaccharide biosynthesis/export family protein n=1 Tax=Novosphingobium sp. AAP83 TaxID=1523425 RepID=UPI0006BA09D2|nr:polysaccharide biosynthesis/export family protein [Novosphingobium sp. AAP83]